MSLDITIVRKKMFRSSDICQVSEYEYLDWHITLVDFQNKSIYIS